MERRVVGIFLLQSGRQNLTQFAILSHLQLHACPDATWYMLSTTHTGGATECCHLVHAVNNSHWRCNRVLLPGTCCQQLTLEVQKRNASGTCQQLTLEVQKKNASGTCCCQQLTLEVQKKNASGTCCCQQLTLEVQKRNASGTCCCQQLTLEVQKRNASSTRQQLTLEVQERNVCCQQLTLEVQERNACCQQLTLEVQQMLAALHQRCQVESGQRTCACVSWRVGNTAAEGTRAWSVTQRNNNNDSDGHLVHLTWNSH